MRIAYCSMLLPEEKKLSERTKERLSGISGHKVTTAEIMGIDANLNKPVDIYNIINTVNYPKFPQLLFHTEKWNHSNIQTHQDYHMGYINLFGIKYITQYYSLRRALVRWVKNSSEPGIICVHSIYLPSILAAVHAQKKSKGNIHLCLNTGDIPGRYGLQSQYKKNIKQLLTDTIINRSIMKLAHKFDSFVFVTKDMAEAFGVQNKPFTVVECTYIEPSYADNNNKEVVSDQKTVFYAGSIREEYGISHLLRAFSMIKDENYKLVIAGGGAEEKLVKEYAQKDKRIDYLGFITPQEVQKRQRASHVLVSPRQSHWEYVKYSFPSKSVDSLASGIPYIAHKLPCDPPEYAEYINYPTDESDEALKNKIIEICEMSKDERDTIGKKARDFILREKNPVVMTERIVDMWKKELKESL